MIREKLSLFEKISYAFPALTLAVIGIPVYVYIPKFYTDSLGVPVAAAGIILLFIRLFDAFTDPLIGLISDRAVTRYGRRRPMILAGALSVSVAIVFLFNPPLMGRGEATLWFGVWVFILFLAWTLVTVPYESLGPELTYDYKERTSLFAVRDGFLLLGILFAASSPVLIKTVLLDGTSSGDDEVFFLMSMFYSPLIALSALWCIYFIKEKDQQIVSRGFIEGFGYVKANRPFMILLVSYTISAIGNNLPATLILYYVEYVLQSNMADLFLVIYFVTGILFLPLWIKIAGRFGKKQAWLAAMALNTGAFSGVFLLGPGDEVLYGILVFLSGMGFGATLAIPSSIQADVIDYDELMTGERREGQYIGIWSLAKKIAAAAGVGIGLSVLGAAGYRPNTVQPDSVVFSLRVLYALVPCLCNAAAIVIAFAYPITEDVHSEIKLAILKRRAGETVEDPLIGGKKY
ncbi:MAG TPA: glycoside-pentoside-hexuronide (GPH):cation symporter [Spirochaetota bacterium]|nr:MFS transporter [Spirochaetota bacterium]HQO39104.1 glycoside-pentoside-hexuronide (GPH):cation symporter [Spirochaetota bacterium]